MRRLTARKAFLKSLPVMGGYLVLGMGFGILARGAGYGTPWVLAMSMVLTPWTSPCSSRSGPPELPGLMGASVWSMMSSSPCSLR